MNPDAISTALNELADLIDSLENPSISRVSSSLERIISKVASGSTAVIIGWGDPGYDEEKWARDKKVVDKVVGLPFWAYVDDVKVLFYSDEKPENTIVTYSRNGNHKPYSLIESQQIMDARYIDSCKKFSSWSEFEIFAEMEIVGPN